VLEPTQIDSQSTFQQKLKEASNQVKFHDVQPRIITTALDLMSKGQWEEAHRLWLNPNLSSITGEQRQLWHAGRTITGCILHPETFAHPTLRSQSNQRSEISSQDTVVFSAITSNHDLSWPLGQLLPSANYLRFTDDPSIPTWDMWQNRPLEYLADSHVRSARWVKTHPHMLFPNSRWAIWLDGNVILVESINTLFKKFQESGHPMATVPHPLRTTVNEEIIECVKRGKDHLSILREHHKMLGEDPVVGLWETNVCFFDLHHPQLKPLLAAWWYYIESGSHRDQISLPYAVAKTATTIHPLLPHGHSTRSDSRFALISHKNKAFEKAHTELLQFTTNDRNSTSQFTTIGTLK
jgi:hypothetical protein